MKAEDILRILAAAKMLYDTATNAVKSTTPPTFEDGTPLTQADVETAWAKADAPWERIEERAKEELSK